MHRRNECWRERGLDFCILTIKILQSCLELYFTLIRCKEGIFIAGFHVKPGAKRTEEGSILTNGEKSRTLRPNEGHDRLWDATVHSLIFSSLPASLNFFCTLYLRVYGVRKRAPKGAVKCNILHTAFKLKKVVLTKKKESRIETRIGRLRKMKK